MGYFGPVLEKKVDDVRIGELRWVSQVAAAHPAASRRGMRGAAA